MKYATLLESQKTATHNAEPANRAAVPESHVPSSTQTAAQGKGSALLQTKERQTCNFSG